MVSEVLLNVRGQCSHELQSILNCNDAELSTIKLIFEVKTIYECSEHLAQKVKAIYSLTRKSYIS